MDKKIKIELEKICNKIFWSANHIKTTAVLLSKTSNNENISDEVITNTMDLIEEKAENILEQHEKLTDILDGRKYAKSG